MLQPVRAAFQSPATGTDGGETDRQAAAELTQQPKWTLAAEDKETLELIRGVIADKDLDGARALLREVVAGLEVPAPGVEDAHIAYLLELARLAEELGSLQESLALWSAILELRTRIFPGDHPDLLAAKQNLAATRAALGDLAGARALEEEVLEARARLLPKDHPDLLAAKLDLAVTKGELGDLAGADELFQQVLEARTRLLPPDHPDLLVAKQNLAVTRRLLGDLAGARELAEEVFEARTRLLPPDHSELLLAEQNLAMARKALGDLQGARELEEELLEARKRLLPPDHPNLLGAKQNLAATRHVLGDLTGARELLEEVLAARTRLLPPDHPDLLVAKLNLAGTRYALGDFAGARGPFEEVVEAWTRLLPPEHPDLLTAKMNLAVTRYNLGDLAGARELEEEVLEARTRLLPGDHPDLLRAKGNLAAMRYELGNLSGARELGEELVEAWTRLLPEGHPDLLAAKQGLAEMRYALGDLAGARELASSLLEGVRSRARTLRSEAARSARESARAELQRVSVAFSWNLASEPEHFLDSELFETVESLRLVSITSAETAHAFATQPDLAEIAARATEARARLSQLAVAATDRARPVEGSIEDAVEDWRKSLLELAEERDRAERALRGKLAEVGAFVEDIDATAVRARLTEGTAVVSFLRYERRSERDPDTGKTPASMDSLLAFVVRPGGAVQRIEFGPAAELEELVRDWRDALGRPLVGRGIGIRVAASRATELEELGRRLRERVLDPILAAAGDVRTLHVVLDDFLHLVPLDALPFEDGILGEHIAVRNEVTFARLLRPERTRAQEGRPLLVGAIDYDTQPSEASTVRLDAMAPPIEASAERSGPSAAGFPFLPETEGEVSSIAALLHEISGQDALLLSGSAATKAALFAAAPKARFLHLATHGWFARESFKSQLDTLSEQGAHAAWRRAEETLTGFAPETLCGLALAGANRGRDAVGRVPGILTAEELATFDLRNCELAVLSACETNVGIRRAGQGIQSLQTALHAAGARTAITSLWKVDDAATRRLFELFYTKLWKEKLGKSAALWQAKMALRAEGHPLRDWAGWVLSGDPE